MQETDRSRAQRLRLNRIVRYPMIPPRVDYALAERGQTLIPPVVALWTWAQDHQAAIETTSRRVRSRSKPMS
jgi:DNA-binding HxlR family transcriptional regulator